MDKMTNIEVYVPEKYLNTENYAPDTLGVYRDLQKNEFCISVAADVIPRYPLRPIMEHFHLRFSKDNGDVHTATVNGKKRKVIELVTGDCKEDSLHNIRTFASINGKNIVNFYLSGFDVVCTLFGEANCTINGKPVEALVLGARCDCWGDATPFDMYDSERGMILPFTDGSALEFPQISEKARIRGIIAKKDYLYLNYLEKNVNKALVFNAQGFYKLLAGEDLEDEVVHGQFKDPQ